MVKKLDSDELTELVDVSLLELVGLLKKEWAARDEFCSQVRHINSLRAENIGLRGKDFGKWREAFKPVGSSAEDALKGTPTTRTACDLFNDLWRVGAPAGLVEALLAEVVPFIEAGVEVSMSNVGKVLQGELGPVELAADGGQTVPVADDNTTSQATESTAVSVEQPATEPPKTTDNTNIATAQNMTRAERLQLLEEFVVDTLLDSNLLRAWAELLQMMDSLRALKPGGYNVFDDLESLRSTVIGQLQIHEARCKEAAEQFVAVSALNSFFRRKQMEAVKLLAGIEASAQSDFLVSLVWRKVCMEMGVPVVAALRESDPQEFENMVRRGEKVLADGTYDLGNTGHPPGEE